MSSLTARLQPPRIRPAAVVAAALAVALASYGVAALRATPPSTSGAGSAAQGDPSIDVPLEAPGGPVLAVGSDLQLLDKSIGIWVGHLQRESRDFYAATNLGILYEARAKITGDVDDYDRAKRAMEQALSIEPAEMAARVVHARVLASLHDFTDALAEAKAILHDDPTQLPALATEGDAQLELGDVAGAAASYEALAKAAPGAAVDARLSRLAFIQGHPDQAWTLAAKAYDEANAEGATGSGLSWYAYVLGTLATTAGRPADALGWYQRAATEWPGSFLALAGEARAEAALGRIADAIRADEAAIAIAPQPDTLTNLGDLYAAEGETTLANQQYGTVEAIGQLQALEAHVFNRQLALFSINHDRDLAQALAMAQQELVVRKDVYGYDTLAWALLANGRAADAETAIREALAFGTRDPLIEYHAGMIEAALGRTDQARQDLGAALAATGALDTLATSRAQAALQALP